MVDKGEPLSDPKEVLVPLDTRIASGLALSGPLLDADYSSAERRLEEGLLEIRDDPSIEYGACIAWCVGVPYEDKQLLGKRLAAAIGAHGQTDLTVEVDGVNILWSGQIYGKLVDLRVNDNSVGLEDLAPVDATVYLLGSHSEAISI